MKASMTFFFFSLQQIWIYWRHTFYIKHDFVNSMSGIVPEWMGYLYYELPVIISTSKLAQQPLWPSCLGECKLDVFRQPSHALESYLHHFFSFLHQTLYQPPSPIDSTGLQLFQTYHFFISTVLSCLFWIIARTSKQQ